MVSTIWLYIMRLPRTYPTPSGGAFSECASDGRTSDCPDTPRDSTIGKLISMYKEPTHGSRTSIQYRRDVQILSYWRTIASRHRSTCHFPENFVNHLGLQDPTRGMVTYSRSSHCSANNHSIHIWCTSTQSGTCHKQDDALNNDQICSISHGIMGPHRLTPM